MEEGRSTKPEEKKERIEEPEHRRSHDLKKEDKSSRHERGRLDREAEEHMDRGMREAKEALARQERKRALMAYRPQAHRAKPTLHKPKDCTRSAQEGRYTNNQTCAKKGFVQRPIRYVRDQWFDSKKAHKEEQQQDAGGSWLLRLRCRFLSSPHAVRPSTPNTL